MDVIIIYMEEKNKIEAAELLACSPCFVNKPFSSYTLPSHTLISSYPNFMKNDYQSLVHFYYIL